MKISLSLVLTLLVFGCSYVRPPVEGRQDPYTPSQMHFDSERLREDTAMGTPVVTRDDSDLLHVQVPIRSAIPKTLYIDYRVTWLDRNGQVINRMGPFEKTLDANTPDSIQVNSTTPRAADFQIDFRYAK